MRRIKKIIILALAFLIIIQPVFADTVLSVDCEVYKNDTVILHESKVMYGRPTGYTIPGNYKIQILDTDKKILFEKSVDLKFMLMTEPPVPTDSSSLSIRVLFDSKMKYLRMFNGEKEIFFREIVACNNNGVCEEFETYLNCPSDCPLGSPDGICIKDNDDICDPDCAPSVDPDCLRCGNGICEEGETYKTCPQDCPTSFVCGNGVCEAGETREDCCTDCGCPEGKVCKESKCVEEKCGNKACEPKLGENYKACPKDCPSGGRDEYCDGVIEGICDQDCSEEGDVDCIKKPNLLVYGIIGIVVAFLLVVILVKSRQTYKTG